jgi:hypothetical protein
MTFPRNTDIKRELTDRNFGELIRCRSERGLSNRTSYSFDDRIGHDVENSNSSSGRTL